MENIRTRSFEPRSYEDFQPLTEWISDDVAETLLIRLPGFSKEQLKVQMDNFGNLRAIGERPLDATGRRYSRFQTEHPIPHSCDVRGVGARFDNNILHITFPKLITVPTTPTPKPEPEPTPEPEKKPPMPEQKQTPKPEPEPTMKPEKKQEPAESKEEEVKEMEEKEQRDVGHDEKEKEGDKKKAAAAPALEKMGIGFLEGIRRPRQLVVNMLVALIVIVVIGMYVGYKLRSGGWVGGDWRGE